MIVSRELKNDIKSIVYLFAVLYSIFLGYKGIAYYIERKYIASVANYYLFVENNWRGIERAILTAQTEEEFNQLMLGVNFYLYVQDNYINANGAKNIHEFAQWQKEEFIKDPRFGYQELFEDAQGFESYTDEMQRIICKKI
jgi:hypothetical protein